MAEDRNPLSRLPGERWTDFAERISDAYGLVLLLVIATYVVTSLVHNTGWPGIAPVAVGGTTAVVALTSSNVPRERVAIAAGLAVLATLVALAAALFDTRQLLGGGLVLEAALLFVAALTVLRRVLVIAHVSATAVLGAVSVYTLLGLLFTYLYSATAHIQGEDFFQGLPHASGSDFIFFSYATLTTTGYGNLVPDGQPGQMFAGLEMLTGQIFLVTLVAGLVSLWRPGQRLSKRGSAG